MSIRTSAAAVTTALLLATSLAACAGAVSEGGGDRLPVVATTTVIADLVRNVGGDLVEVEPLVPAGGEPHTFDPDPSDVTSIESAAIIFANGLGLDDWLGDLVADASAGAPLVMLGENLRGVAYRQGGEHEGAGLDPHVWLNVAYAKLYVARIADELAAVDSGHADAYRSNADAYAGDLDALDAYARDTLRAIPEANRSVVSFHDAFGYFADAYGLIVVDTVVEAPGQDPSAGEVAALIDAIRASAVRAILAESQFPTNLVDRIAEETGATVVANLHSDSLGNPPADSYLGMIRTDVDAIAEALR